MIHADIPDDPSGLPEVGAIIQRALEEDIRDGDVTTLSVVHPEEETRAVLIAKGQYVLAGAGVAARVFKTHDPDLKVTALGMDGQPVTGGQTILELSGRAGSMLTAERVALNLVQRLTGIATLTRTYVDRTEGSRAVILGTRKTTPGLRVLETYAIACGGGGRHRMGLYDKVLLKDNHLALWRRRHEGTLADMVRAARRAYPGLEIEVEVESKEDLALVLEGEPDWVLLDNMRPDELRACVALADGRCKLEASGGVTLDSVASIAASGVDAISVGALTHSAPAADLSLEIVCDP